MTGFERYLSAAAGVDALDGFSREAALAVGFDPTVATQWQKLWNVYHGEKRFAHLAREAIRAARAGGFSLDQLRLIERRVAHIKDRMARWKYRIELMATPCSYRGLEKRIEQTVPAKKKRRTKSMRLTKSSEGIRSMFLTTDERDLADLEHYLRQGIDPKKPKGPQMLKRFLELIRGKKGGVAHAAPQPVVVVPLDEHTKVLRGDGDDVVLGLTDGTTMTGAEYLNLVHGSAPLAGEVALFHPQEGAVNLYRAERYANAKQRRLAKIMHTVCPVPGCKEASEYCEVHHIKAWSQGGETNMSNLTVLCRYHNRVNVDNPKHTNRRGNMQRRGGVPMWVAPNGQPVPNTTHPYGAAHTVIARARRRLRR